MVIEYDGRRISVENPSTCPHCHNGIEPSLLSQHLAQGTNYSIWQCKFRECKKNFIAAHKYDGANFQFTGFIDGTPITPFWPSTIKNLDSKFIKTYEQALKAESLGLDEISGMGFRKSIEYLVKDYLIQRNPDLKGTIEDNLLAKVIGENFVHTQEADLKDLLQRATWLGNDMTHYLKYHENFDLKDLKELIQLVMDEIHSIEQKRHYINSIQSKYSK